jgi:hypothetical protein
VTANGGSQFAGSWGPQTSSATVTPTEATAAASVIKSFVHNEAACVTVRYGVEVDNTSNNAFTGVCGAAGKCTAGKIGASCSTAADCNFTVEENETLSALSDSAYADLTTLHGSVLGTNCNQASWTAVAADTSAAGTGGGLFGSIAPGSNYTCQFDAQFCGSLASNNCFSQSDTVTATLVGDEATDGTFAAASNQISVQECVTATPSSP